MAVAQPSRPDSDIDIAVVVPSINGDYYSTAAHLWRITMDVNTLNERVLIEEIQPSTLNEDILFSGKKKKKNFLFLSILLEFSLPYGLSK